MPSKDENRWERLAALGVKREMPTPEGEAKMSAVVLQLADPLMNCRWPMSYRSTRARVGVPLRGHSRPHPALHDAPAELVLHRSDEGEEARDPGGHEEGVGDGGAKAGYESAVWDVEAKTGGDIAALHLTIYEIC